jgi:hypothetical protein
MRRRIFVPVAVALFVGVSFSQQEVSAQAPATQVPAKKAPAPEAPVVSQTYLPLPPPPQETIVAQPSPEQVWVGGHWDRTPDKWNWIPGSWIQPPFSNAYWQPGYWQHQDGTFVWEDAHWAAANQGVVVSKPVVVPPVYAEVQPAAPVGNPVVWQPGHWEWRGTWVWIPGAYVPSTIANATFIPGQWVRGLAGFWRWSPGHWAN